MEDRQEDPGSIQEIPPNGDAATKTQPPGSSLPLVPAEPRGWLPDSTLPLPLGTSLIFPLETLDPTGCIQQLLLPRKEGMALGADLHSDLGPGGASVDDFSTRTGDRGLDVVGMNARLHGAPPHEVIRITASYQKFKEFSGLILRGELDDDGDPPVS
jgi:hypothetical protein